jgi:translocation and assembly module TamB
MASERAPASPRRRHPVLRWLLAAVAALLLLLVLAGAWLLGSESGARSAFSALDSVTSGALKAAGVHGSLRSPLRLDQLVLRQPDRTITISDLRIAWTPSALLHSTLHLTSVQAARIAIVNRIDSKPQPATLPDRIGLPLKLQADRVQIASGELDRGPVNLATFGPLAFAVDFDGARYRFRLQELAAHTGASAGSLAAMLQGEATLSATKPYPLQGSFSARSNAVLNQQPVAASGRLTLSGSLAALETGIDVAINHAKVQGHALLRPFAGQPLGATQLNIRALDLALFGKQLPHTALDAELAVSAQGAGTLKLDNAAAGTWDAHRLPLSTLNVAFTQDAERIRFDRIHALLGSVAKPAGEIAGNGGYADGALTLALRTDALDLHRLDLPMRTTQLAGTVELRNASGRQEFTLALREPVNKTPITLDAHGVLADAALTLDRAELQAGNGRASLSAQLALNGDQAFNAQGSVSKFRLRDLGDFAQLPALDLNGDFSLHGKRQPALEADLAFKISDSQLAGQPLHGNGNVQLRADHLQVSKLLLVAGANRLDADGRLAQGDSKLSFDLNAPQLRQFGPAFSGALQAKGTVSGSMEKPRINAEWQARNAHAPGELQIDAMQGKAQVSLDRKQPLLLDSAQADISARGLRVGGNSVAALTAQARFSPQPDAPLALTLHAERIAAGELRAERLDANADGSTAHHALTATLNETGQAWQLVARGGLDQRDKALRWQGDLSSFTANGRFNAKLQAPAPLLLSSGQVKLDRFVLDTEAGRIALDQFTRDADGLATRGRIEHLQIAPLLHALSPAPPVKTDLQLSGEWDVRIADALNGKVALRRDSGDVTVLGSAPVTLGLDTLRLSADADAGRATLQLAVDGRQLGHIEASTTTRIGDANSRVAIAPDAPISGSVHIDVPSLGWIAPLASPSLIADGRLQTDLTIAGTFGTPSLSGRIAGSGLRLSFADLGLDLRNGSLQGEFRDDQLLLQNLSFQSDKGHLAVSGPIRFSGGQPDAQLALTADHFALLNRSDRRLVLSGDSRITLHDQRAKVSGAFTVDSGSFDIGQAGRPALSDDVVVVGRKQKEAARLGLALDITVGLGDGVALTGRGLDATLVGKVRLASDVGESPQAYGELSIAKGTFSAYGRELKIEQGVLRFNGPINNPSLDIVAMRRGQEVEAGVSVGGNVLAPRITLVSEPNVPDAEKLSWLVLGHGLASATPGDTGTLQSAASSLLSRGAASAVQSRIAGAIGLDTLSVGTSDDSLQQRIITVGKQLSSRLYVSYQQGLESAGSVVLLRYILSPRLTLEGETGARSALSLLYNISFD